MTGILCHYSPRERTEKPQSPQEYGSLRDYVIQRQWDYLSEETFIRRVTEQGCPFYGCLFKGSDLMELQQQKLCWLTQTIVGVDFDKCEIPPLDIVKWYTHLALEPWVAYRTFSDGCQRGRHSYRLLWKVKVDLNASYEDTHAFIKRLSSLAGEKLADARSMDPTRLWQGSRSGCVYRSNLSKDLSISKLS